MLVTDIEITLVYQLVFVLALLIVALTSFVILVRYTGWLKIHLDRVFDLYKIDNRAIDSSIASLTIIAKSKGMDFVREFEDDDENVDNNVPRGKYREFTDI